MKPAELKVRLAGVATIRNLRTVQTTGSRRNAVPFRFELTQIEGEAKKKPRRKKKGGGE